MIVMSLKQYVRIKCPNCILDFSQEAKLLRHLTVDHNITEYESFYVETQLGGMFPLCKCGCGERVRWNGWKKGYTSTIVKGHNARVYNVFADKERQREVVAKRTEGYRTGKYKVWNDGLTKESSETIKNGAMKASETLQRRYESGELVNWAIKDPQKAQEASKKISETKKRKYEAGELSSWNAGLTKESDERLKRISQKNLELNKIRPVKSSKRITPQKLVEILSSFKNFTLLTDPNTYRNKYQRLEFKCNVCRTVQLKNLMMITSAPMCYICHPKESLAQLELFEFIKELASDAVLSDRTVIKPKELDIYVPNKRLGFEFNGLYWHSEACGDTNRLALKTQLAEANDIDVFHIFDDEWKQKKSVVKTMIQQRLLTPTRVFDASQCSVRILNSDEQSQFFDANHLEGDNGATSAYGLFNDEELLSAIAILNSTLIVQYVTVPNVTINNGLQKLSAYAAEISDEDIIAILDKRFGRQERTFADAGYTFICNDEPTYWLTDCINRYAPGSIEDSTDLDRIWSSGSSKMFFSK